jgi:phosphatidylglycerol---prolipoprotein diacylglyceryl transferase
MHQILFTVAGHPVYAHETFVALGFLVGLAVFVLECRRRHSWDDRLVPVIAGIVVGGAVGARLGGLVDAALQDGPTAVVWAWDEVGRSILGGLAGAYGGALIGKRVGGYPYRTGDLFAPAVALGLAVGRIGCFLSEAPGRPTSLSWAITVDPTVPIPDCAGCVAGVGMHPSFLYEIAFLLAAFAALVWARRRVHGPGELFVLFICGYAAFRFGVEFTRANAPVLWGLTGSQLFILATAPLLIARLVKSARLGTFRQLRTAPPSVPPPERRPPDPHDRTLENVTPGPEEAHV